MKEYTKWFARVILIGALIVLSKSAVADTTIATFDENFYLDGLFANWAAAPIISDTNGYTVPAMGFGSGYKDINPNIDATGETMVELTVTIVADTGPTNPASGPIVSLVDGDGTFVNFAWYGQTIGTHVLTASLESPTWVTNPGSTNGLDLSNLDFFHLQDDPGAYQGAYTITFERFRLIGKVEPVLEIISHSFNPATREFSLTWSSLPDKNYSVLESDAVSGNYSPLVTDVASGGDTTSATVTMPDGDAGYLQIEEQP